jgi:4-amino-4-deoxy-L-arabinose transferase-like glycosyltransferase
MSREPPRWLLEGSGVAASLGFAVALLAAQAALGGSGLLWPDEHVYALAARELALGGRPICHAVTAHHVQALGFPYEEVHAPGQVHAVALAFRLLGPSEKAALLPSVSAFLLLVLAAYATFRRLGVRPRLAALSVGLLGLFPTNAAFAFTAFAEMPLALATTLGALSILLRPRHGIVLLAGAVVLGIAFRESSVALIPASRSSCASAPRGNLSARLSGLPCS